MKTVITLTLDEVHNIIRKHATSDLPIKMTDNKDISITGGGYEDFRITIIDKPEEKTDV